MLYFIYKKQNPQSGTKTVKMFPVFKSLFFIIKNKTPNGDENINYEVDYPLFFL